MRGVEIKTPEQIIAMRKAGLAVAAGLQAMGEAVRPGISTGELDQIGRDVLASHGATSNFLGYGAAWGMAPFPGVACISVNEEIVHGIPGERVLESGDLVSIDFGGVINGWHGDAARTFLVGECEQAVVDLCEHTRQSLWAGIGAAALGKRVGAISAAIEDSIEGHGLGYGIVEDYTGHGIGTKMHMEPDVPNYRTRGGRGIRIVEGLVLAIEPMVTLGNQDSVTLDDEWTVVTRDGSVACHWENTMTVTRTGVWVLTEPDGGEAELAKLGVPFGPLAD